MDTEPVLAQLDILWRLTGRKTPGEHATALSMKLQELRPRMLEIMMEMVILELEDELPAASLTMRELEILLNSPDARVRAFGIRLAPQARE